MKITLTLTRKDLIDAYSGTPIDDITVHHFKGTMRPFREADVVTFQDEGNVRVLKGRPDKGEAEPLCPEYLAYVLRRIEDRHTDLLVGESGDPNMPAATELNAALRVLRYSAAYFGIKLPPDTRAQDGIVVDPMDIRAAAMYAPTIKELTTSSDSKFFDAGITTSHE